MNEKRYCWRFDREFPTEGNKEEFCKSMHEKDFCNEDPESCKWLKYRGRSQYD